MEDELAAWTRKRDFAPDGTLMAQEESRYVWTDWGFARTNKVEGFGGATRATSWDYVMSGPAKGSVRERREQSGLVTAYEYDAEGRIVAETKSAPGCMTNRVERSYAPVAPGDAAAPVDVRPRIEVKYLDGIECGRTYWVYTALTDVVERVGTQGAAYGGTNALRTVTA